MTKTLRMAILIFIFFCFGVAGAVAAERMSVKVETANVRAMPDTKADTLWQVEKYYPFQVLEKKGEWYRVKDFEGDSGWVNARLLDKTATVIIKVNRANVRVDAGTQYNMAFDADKGTPFKVLEKKEGWLKIEHADGDSGWILNTLVW